MADAAFSIAKASGLTDPVGRRRAAILLGSIAFHVAVLTPLALRMVDTADAPAFDATPPPIFLEMEPRPLLEGETAREPTFARTVETAPALSRATITERTPSLYDEDGIRTPPSPRIAASAPPGSPPAPADAWRVTPEPAGAAIARSMRTGAAGCRILNGQLSLAEQQLCDDRFVETASRAGPPGPRTLTPAEARRDDGFATQARANEAWREYMRGDGAYPGLRSLFTQH